MFGRPRDNGIEVREGRLSERSTGDDHAIVRRAYGEFVGPRGELASYAVGWTSNADPREARISIGIGRGNPGGGTFHAAVIPHGEAHGCALIDEPFESVPQGGPHLSASDARAHVDLPFVWAVVDTVMQRDRRAAWMLHWLRGTIAFVTEEVAARKEPVLLVVHDHDGDWQLIGTSDADPATGRIEHLHHLLEHDRSLLEVLDLAPGEDANRQGTEAPWKRGARSDR